MKTFNNLREFLDLLKNEKQLIEISDEVMLETDLSAAGRAISRVSKDEGPALYFNHIRGYHHAEIIMNVHGSWPNLALMLGLEKDASLNTQFFEFVERYQRYPGEVAYQTSAPWQEVVIDKNINLFEILPLFRLNAGDGGFYIDKACIISRDPDDWKNDDTQNVGIYRLQVKGKNRLGIQPASVHDIAVHIRHADEANKDLPVAIAIANEPIIPLCAATPMLYNQSEYKLAGALQGKPYPVFKTPLGLDAPVGAQYVIEGRILARQREIEGPLAEFPGQYSGCRKYPVIEIDRISHCKNPLYESLYLGLPWTEIDYMCAVNTSAPLFMQLKKDFPEIVAVNAIYIHGFAIIVSTKRRYGGFAKAVALRVLSTPHGLGYAKLVIVVDEDVDPFDMNQVMWAVTTKMNPAGDVFIIPNLSINQLDPASQPEGMSHKMVVDATTPIPPDKRGNFSQRLKDPLKTDEWKKKLATMVKELRK
jgi:UbiD family decarboxylase